MAAGPVSRILSAGKSSRTIIPLGPASLRGSSDLPEGLAHRASTRPGKPELPSYLVLLRVGFALPVALLRRRCALTAPFHPYRALPPGGIFSVALSVDRAWTQPPGRYPAHCSAEFGLSSALRQRPSDPAANKVIICDCGGGIGGGGIGGVRLLC